MAVDSLPLRTTTSYFVTMHSLLSLSLSLSPLSRRYDLHEWLFTLHNAIETFKTKQKKAEERRRMPQRLRANTVDSIHVLPPHPSDTGTTTSSIRTLTPTRRAPPAPPGAQATAANGKTSSSPRRKPVRPAPVAPGVRRNRSQTQPLLSPTSVTSQEGVGPVAMVLESPPPSYSDASSGTPVHSQQEVGGVMDSLGSGVHPIMDLDIHTEQDDFGQEGRYHHDNEGGARSLRPQSASDTLLLMHQNSASLPDLMNCDDHEVGVANGDAVTEGVAGEGRNRGSHLQRSASGASQTRHTRHLSLIGNEDIERANLKQPPRDHRKKRSSRRNGSIKLRSRSPPNMPPPPPPTTVEEDTSEREETTMATNKQTLSGAEQNQQGGDQTDVGLHLPPQAVMQNGISGELPSQSSSSSVGFSEVMNTISNIDHELDDIAITPTKPSIPAPQRSMSNSSAQVQHGQSAEFTVGEMKDDFNEEEWLCDVPDSETTPISPKNRPAPEGGPPSAEEDSETEPTQKKSTNQKQAPHESFVSADQLISGGFLPAATIEMTSDPGQGNSKSGKGKHRVMFKEEVEDIPNYEPRVDQEFSPTNGEEVRNKKYSLCIAVHTYMIIP